jgi:hypothetical protein
VEVVADERAYAAFRARLLEDVEFKAVFNPKQPRRAIPRQPRRVLNLTTEATACPDTVATTRQSPQVPAVQAVQLQRQPEYALHFV